MHLSVAVVFSSIFNHYGLSCTIVGGQAAAYWSRTPGSADVDIVTESPDKISAILENCNFKQSEKNSFRYIHEKFDVLIELVSDSIDIAGIKNIKPVSISPSDIDDPVTASLMPGVALVTTLSLLS